MPDPIILLPDRFAPANDVRSSWKSVGEIAHFSRNANQANRIDLFAANGGPAPCITFLSDTVFRVRFHASGSYAQRPSFDPQDLAGLSDSRDPSYAVVTQDLVLPPNLNATRRAADDAIVMDTGRLQIIVGTRPYSLSVSAHGQTIHADAPLAIRYILESVVNFKRRKVDAYYLGFGEKSGTSLDQSGRSMTFFNFDNFTYDSFGGDPLYISIPLLIETHPTPIGLRPYSYRRLVDHDRVTLDDLCSLFRGPGVSPRSLGYFWLRKRPQEDQEENRQQQQADNSVKRREFTLNCSALTGSPTLTSNGPPVRRASPAGFQEKDRGGYVVLLNRHFPERVGYRRNAIGVAFS